MWRAVIWSTFPGGTGLLGGDLDEVEAELRAHGLADLAHRQRKGGRRELGDHAIAVEGAQVAAARAAARVVAVLLGGSGEVDRAGLDVRAHLVQGVEHFLLVGAARGLGEADHLAAGEAVVLVVVRVGGVPVADFLLGRVVTVGDVRERHADVFGHREAGLARVLTAHILLADDSTGGDFVAQLLAGQQHLADVVLDLRPVVVGILEVGIIAVHVDLAVGVAVLRQDLGGRVLGQRVQDFLVADLDLALADGRFDQCVLHQRIPGPVLRRRVLVGVQFTVRGLLPHHCDLLPHGWSYSCAVMGVPLTVPMTPAFAPADPLRSQPASPKPIYTKARNDRAITQ
jgi:hypothetical protein